MTAVTLTAGNLGGAYGYNRSGSPFFGGTPGGSISAEPMAGQIVNSIYKDSGSNGYLYLAGNTVSLGLLTLLIDGVDAGLPQVDGWRVYEPDFDSTGYFIPSSALGFTNGASYSLDLFLSPDTTAPTITSSDTASVAENATLAHSLTASETVTWSIVGGADQAQFEISGSTLRWAGNGTVDFDVFGDADGNNTYIVDIRAADLAGNTADQTITVTVTAVYEGPTWVGVSTALASASAGTIDFSSSGRQAGDRLYIAVATANETIATPSGFTEDPRSPRSRGSAGNSGAIRLGLFYKDSNGSETTVAIADSGNHQYAIGAVIRPAAGLAIAVDVGDGKDAAASSTHSGLPLATTVRDTLIVDFWGSDIDAAGSHYSGHANADLANLTERHDAGTTAGQGSGIVIYTGERQAPGSVVATTATSVSSVIYTAITLALKSAIPVASLSPPRLRHNAHLLPHLAR